MDGVRIHFVHHRAADGGVPLVLTHGWPSTFVEMLSLVDRLGDRFDLVVPSLPGYAFSQRPPRTGVDRAFVAGLWHRLMQGLGYQRYGAHGGDFGAGVATYMALLQPDRMIGIHLSTPEMWPYTGPGAPPLSAEEQAYVDHVTRWDETERGYSAVQSTRPQTLGYGLNDSPAGLAAWVLDKWRSWSDSGGDLDARFGRDALLTMLTIWWATGSITSSMRDYYDNRWHGTPSARRTSWGCRPRWRCSPTGSCAKGSHHGPGTSGCTTFGVGRSSPAAVISPRLRSPTCWPATSPDSSPDLL